MKRLLIAVAILVVIVAVWQIQEFTESKKTRSDLHENFLGIDNEAIDRLEIIKPDETIDLFKRDNKWTIYNRTREEERPADYETISNTILASSKITVGKVISTNPDKQINFQVDDSSGMVVNYYSGEELQASLVVGKLTSRRTHTFIRKSGSNNVYEAEGPITYVFGRPYTGWLDQTIVSVLSGNLMEVELQFEAEHFKLIRNESGSGWSISKFPFSQNVTAEDAPVNAYLNSLLDIRAVDFLNASDSGYVDFENYSLKLNINKRGGKTIKLTFGKLNDDTSRIYITKEGFDEIYVIRKSLAGGFRKPYSYFLSP